MTVEFLQRPLQRALPVMSAILLLPYLSSGQTGLVHITDKTGIYRSFQGQGMSADGKVIYGKASDALRGDIPVIWDAQHGFQPLPFPLTSSVYLYGISSDGSVVVGYESRPTIPTQDLAFSWSKSGTQYLPALGVPPGTDATAFAFCVSADGRKVGGWSSTADSCSGASTLWLDGTPNMLERMNYCGSGASVDAISPHGNFVFGQETDATGKSIIKWGMNSLGIKVLSGLSLWKTSGSSYNGDTVVAGITSNLSGLRITPLSVDTIQYLPEAISWDGLTIIGRGYLSDSGRVNMKSLKEVCERDYGIDCSGITFTATPAISADGTVVLIFDNAGSLPQTYRLEMKKTISVITPKDSVYVVDGSKGTIRWRTPVGVDTVNIYYTLDSGKTRAPISLNYAVRARRDSLQWTWPDVVSQDCKIFIEASRDTSIKGESPFFTNRGYRLLRVDPTTKRYELFDLARHGWQFGNKAPVMWPGTWWVNFAYNGLAGNKDPYTNSKYPDRDPFKHALSSDFIDWPLFVRTMGEQECYYFFGGNTTGYYKGTAEAFWGATKHKWHGSCYGFAVSTLMAFYIPTQLAAAFPEMPPYNQIPYRYLLSGFGATDQIRKVINSLFFSQYGKQHSSYYHTKFSTTVPNQTLAEIEQMFLSDANDSQPLSIIPSNAEGGHEVVPYRVENEPPGSPIFRIYVDDSNIPTDTGAYIELDTSWNHWTYTKLKNSSGAAWAGQQGLTLDDRVSLYVNPPVLPKAGSPYLVRRRSPFLANDSTWAVYIPTESPVTISDNLGRTMRVAGDTVKNDIPGAYPMKPFTPTSPPPGYVLPKGEYTTQIGPFGDTSAAFTFITDAMIYTYRRGGVQTGEVDRFRIGGDGVMVRNSDLALKRYDLGTVIPAPNDSSERRVLLSGLTAAQGDSLLFSVDSASNARVRNFSSHLSQYNLSLLGYRYIQGVGVDQQQFVHLSITLGPASTHIVNPAWDDMNGKSLKIYIDNGNHGTINDSLIAQNDATGVDDHRTTEVPKTYVLMQNYPDPFNPATTIEFGLPEQSVVELKVYTILGQEVTTLAGGTLSAGTYRCTFDASRLATGVYVYRLKATSLTAPSKTFSEVRKMLFVK